MLAVDNLHDAWYGESDDMIFLAGAMPNVEYVAPYSAGDLRAALEAEVRQSVLATC